MTFTQTNWLSKKFSTPGILFLLSTLIAGNLTGCNYLFNSSPQSPSPEDNHQQKLVIFQALEQEQQRLNLCSQQRDQNLSPQSINIYFINQDKYLVEILCFLGAYQPNYQYFLAQFNSYQLTEFQPLIFTTFQNQSEDLRLTNTRTLTGSTELDWQNKLLTVVTQGRGLGDCGSFAVYKWSGDRFDLQQFRHKANCDGVYLAPEDYPLIYP